MKQFFLAITALLVLSPSAGADQFRFNVYPDDAKIYRVAGTSNLEEPVGPARDAHDYSNCTGLVRIIIKSDGRQNWERDFQAAALEAGGTFEEPIYLKPNTLPLMVTDAFERHFVPTSLLLLLVLGAPAVLLLAKRKKEVKATNLDVLGAEQETRFGPYLLGRCLGAGGMGEVYLAARADDYESGVLKRHQTTALKRMRPSLDGQDELDRFKREMKIVRDLQHPNIVQVMDTGDVDGCYYLAMEVVEGETLRDLLDREPIPAPTKTRKVLRELGQALSYAHSKDITHRDVKPGNVMLTKQGTLKLLDFGLARKPVHTNSITAAGTALGTFGYVDPHQAKSDGPSPLSDQFSLATVAFEMLTGEIPAVFDWEDAMSFHTYLEQERPLASSRNPKLTPEIDQVLSKMLELDPSKRYPTMDEAVAALDQALAKQPEYRV